MVAALAAVVPAATASVPTGGRAWELITPPDPVSAVIGTPTLALPSADRLAYSSIGPMPGAAGGDLLATNLAVRTPTGWRTEPVGTPYFVPRIDFRTLFGVGVPASNQGLTRFVFGSSSPLLPAGPAEPRLGLYRAGPGGLSLIADLGREGGFGGASADTGHVVFRTSEHLLPGDAGRTSGESIYESVGATLRLVDVADDGSLLSECGSSVPSRTMSTDGNRIFFMTAVSCAGPQRLFLREAGTTTTEVSASRCTRPDCNAPQDASFAGATPDGSVAFLTTEQQLVDEDENALRDLYRFEVESGELSLVSPGDAAMEGSVADRTVLTTADGARTYFRADGRLLPSEEPEAGPRLYLVDEGGLHLVAPINPENMVQISADGGIAVLEASERLVPGDEDDAIDVYRYAVATAALTRLSTGVGGGNGPFDAQIAPASTLRSAADEAMPSRAMSADGNRVFFDTAEPLVGEDRNAVLDVYEWSQGALGLISSGSAAAPAHFGVTSRDGDIVVFRTAAGLLGLDRDGGDLDLYAARVGGGFDESSPPPRCSRCGGHSGRLARAAPASAKPAARRARRIRLRPLGEDAGRQLVKTGGVVLELAVPAPGRVSAQAQSLGAKDPARLAQGVAGAVRPGALRLHLLATAAARRELAREGTLRLRLRLRQGPLALSRVVVLRLEGTR